MIHIPDAVQKKLRVCLVSVVLLIFTAGVVHPAAASGPIVRAVLFASPTCSHCAYIKDEVLPPLVTRYGSQLQIATVSTATRSGYELFLSASMKHGLLELSVPLLIVGNTAMVGSGEIPLKFPGLIEKHIAAGGIDWPGIPGLNAMLEANPAFAHKLPENAAAPEPPKDVTAPETAEVPQPAGPSAAAGGGGAEAESPEPSAETVLPEKAPPPAASTSSSVSGRAESKPDAPPAVDRLRADSSSAVSTPSMPEPSGIIDLTGSEPEAGIVDRIKRDIYGNGLAIMVLTGMILTLLLSPTILRRKSFEVTIRPGYDWFIPFLTLAGLGVAAYLSHVEVSQVKAVCGPVGDCNTVNQSEYAKLFGVLPIGVLGFVGFLAVLSAWSLRRWGSVKAANWAAVAILGMTGFGTLFSVYLTFLEPFVIGATCLWCLSSAVIMTTLFVLALGPGCHAWSELKRT